MTLKIMKFGGTSLSDADGIRRVAQIITEERGNVVVCSAFSGITNALILSGEQAALGDDVFKGIYKTIVQRHQEAVERLSLHQDHTLQNHINEMHKELEQLLEGVFLLREFSPRTRDLV